MNSALPRTPDLIGELFREHGKMVRGLLLRVVGPGAELDDLVQTTFLEALRSLPRYRGDAKPSTWICSIAMHVAHHQLRSKRVWRYIALEGAPDRVLTQPDVDRDDGLDTRKIAARLEVALSRIQPTKRDALLAHVLEEQPVCKIAQAMSATQTATRSRMFFARRELRALIARDPALSDHAAGLLRRSATKPVTPRKPRARRALRPVAVAR